MLCCYFYIGLPELSWLLICLASLSSAFCESLWRPTQNIPFLLSPYPTRSRLLQLSSTYEKIGVKVFLANIHGKRRMFRGLQADEGLGWD